MSRFIEDFGNYLRAESKYREDFPISSQYIEEIREKWHELHTEYEI